MLNRSHPCDTLDDPGAVSTLRHQPIPSPNTGNPVEMEMILGRDRKLSLSSIFGRLRDLDCGRFYGEHFVAAPFEYYPGITPS